MIYVLVFVWHYVVNFVKIAHSTKYYGFELPLHIILKNLRSTNWLQQEKDFYDPIC